MQKQLKKLFLFQILVAAFGTLFAFTSVYFDYKRFYAIEGSITKIKDCSIPNPVLTPCFWGAFGFLAATIWAYILYRKYSHSQGESSQPIESLKNQQKYFTAFASFGTAFAWGNMTLEIIKYFNAQGETYTGCSGQLVTNPLLTPCFGGSVIFLSLFVMSIFVYKYLNNSYVVE